MSCSNETLLNASLQGLNNTTSNSAPFGTVMWQMYLKIIFIPLFFVIGLLGNTLSFVVLSSGSYRRKSYSYYLRALSVFDSLTVTCILVLEMNDVMFDVGVLQVGFLYWHTKWTCKVSEMMRWVSVIMSSWLLVCFSLDRLVAVCFPLKRARFCTERVAVVTMVILTVLVMMSQSYHLYYVEVLRNRTYNKHQLCHAHTTIRVTYFGINYIWSNFLLRFAIPFYMICLCNGMIVCHVKRVESLRLTRKKCERVSLAVYTLYAVCFMFIVSLLPDSIISLTHYIMFINNSTAFYNTFRTLEVPFGIIRLMNYSTNFILYGLTGRQFRRQLRRLVASCFTRCCDVTEPGRQQYLRQEYFEKFEDKGEDRLQDVFEMDEGSKEAESEGELRGGGFTVC